MNIVSAIHQDAVHTVDITDSSFPRGHTFQTSDIAFFIGDFLISHERPPVEEY